METTIFPGWNGSLFLDKNSRSTPYSPLYGEAETVIIIYISFEI